MITSSVVFFFFFWFYRTRALQVGVVGSNCVVIAAEKFNKRQNSVCSLDGQITVAWSGNEKFKPFIICIDVRYLNNHHRAQAIDKFLFALKNTKQLYGRAMYLRTVIDSFNAFKECCLFFKGLYANNSFEIIVIWNVSEKKKIKITFSIDLYILIYIYIYKVSWN